MKKHLTLLSITFLILTGCKFEGEFIDFGSERIDFLKSYIANTSVGVADGATILNVQIFLVNSDGSKVVGFTPSYNASFSGLNHLGCTKSTEQGLSICSFTSSNPGTFLFSVNNTKEKNDLQEDLTFTPLTTGVKLAEVSSGGQKSATAPGSYKVDATVGATTSQGVFSAPGGYKVFAGFQTSTSE